LTIVGLARQRDLPAIWSAQSETLLDLFEADFPPFLDIHQPLDYTTWKCELFRLSFIILK